MTGAHIRRVSAGKIPISIVILHGNAPIFGVYGLIFYVYEGIFAVYESIFGVYGCGFGVYGGSFWIYEGISGVYESIFSVFRGTFSENGCRKGLQRRVPAFIKAANQSNQTQGVAFYDSAGVFYDSGVLYDSAPSSLPERKKKMAKIKLGLQGMSPDQKVAFMTTVITSMTGNANFTTPNPTLASGTTLKNSLQTGINDYNASVATSQTKLATRDAAELAADGFLTSLAAYVENVSNGDRVKIESAGFSVRGDASPVGPLTQVLNLVLTAGDNEGTLDAAWDPLRGAGSYEVQTSADPVSGTSWTFKTVSNKSSVTLDGLTTGNRVWVRVRGIGAGNNKGPWSDPAVKTVP